MRLAVLERRNRLRDVPFTIVSRDASSFARDVSVLIEPSKKKLWADLTLLLNGTSGGEYV
jgi:hypothetical protein